MFESHAEGLKAFLLGWHQAFDHPEEASRLILEKYSRRHSLEHLNWEAEQVRKLVLPEILEIGYQNPGRWRHILDSFRKVDPALPEVDLDSFVHGRLDPGRGGRLALTWLACLSAAGLAVPGIRKHLTMRRRLADQTIKLGELGELTSLVPVCKSCNRICDEDGRWVGISDYLAANQKIRPSSLVCPACRDSKPS